MNQVSEISRGCQLCQQGKWLCIFLTYKCNADCAFCPAPSKENHIHSAFGNQKDEILTYLKNSGFEGISFSGGDPFLVFDRLAEWFIFFKKLLPDYYYWVYTNGLAVDREKLVRLAKGGMDEIRFNIAASGYLSPGVWEKIEIARDLFPYVTVEIPSIKQDFDKLVEAMEILERMGVDFVNLHEYILQDDSVQSRDGEIREFCLNKTIRLVSPVSSRQNTEAILALASKKEYRLNIHHCSLLHKEEQMLQRRLKMGQIFNDPEYDILLKDGTICNLYRFPVELVQNILNTPVEYLDLIAEFGSYVIPLDGIRDLFLPDTKIIKALHIPKMEMNQEKVLLKIDEVKKEDVDNLIQDIYCC